MCAGWYCVGTTKACVLSHAARLSNLSAVPRRYDQTPSFFARIAGVCRARRRARQSECKRQETTEIVELPALRGPHFCASVITLTDERVDIVEGRQSRTLHQCEESAPTDEHSQKHSPKCKGEKGRLLRVCQTLKRGHFLRAAFSVPTRGRSDESAVHSRLPRLFQISHDLTLPTCGGCPLDLSGSDASSSCRVNTRKELATMV